MKIGLRKPSLKRMVRARTTGRAKRCLKKALVPGYGKKGVGILKNPARATRGMVYRRTTFSVSDIFRWLK